MTRYEIKLVGRAIDLPRIRSELRLLPECLRQLHPERCVQSIYLDSYDGQALRDNLAGISSRRKVRLRWYGEATTSVLGVLECKRRFSQLGDKDLHPLTGPIRLAGNDRRAFLAELHRLTPTSGRPLLLGCEAVQWIRYWREYLGSADGQLRITIDRQLTAFDQRYSSLLQCTRATPLPAVVVLEVKAAASHGAAISRWLQRVPLRPGKCSKFVLAHHPRNALDAGSW